MNKRFLRITGRDPLLFGDGRPFTDDADAMRAQTLPFPLPGTLAGMIRTFTGETLGWKWSHSDADRARMIEIHGPLLMNNDRALFPAPADALPRKEGFDALLLEAPGEGEGCNLPAAGLRPTIAPFFQGKRPRGRDWWTQDEMFAWLAGKPLKTGKSDDGENKLAPGTEERVHVAIAPSTGAGKDGALFTTTGLSFGPTSSLLARVSMDAGSIMDDEPPSLTYQGLWTFGGERRLALLEEASASDWPACPESLHKALGSATTIRMILSTPALFKDGWKPGWLNNELCGSPPGVEGITLRLVGAAVPRRQPVSGWDLENKCEKAVRWMAPAGSVYFFETAAGSAQLLSDKAWLRPVSDDKQDQRDGYGLALWGICIEQPDRDTT